MQQDLVGSMDVVMKNIELADLVMHLNINRSEYSNLLQALPRVRAAKPQSCEF